MFYWYPRRFIVGIIKRHEATNNTNYCFSGQCGSYVISSCIKPRVQSHSPKGKTTLLSSSSLTQPIWKNDRVLTAWHLLMSLLRFLQRKAAMLGTSLASTSYLPFQNTSGNCFCSSSEIDRKSQWDNYVSRRKILAMAVWNNDMKTHLTKDIQAPRTVH